VEVTELAGGANSTVYAAKVRSESGPDLVMKIYRPVHDWEMEQEVYVYGLLRDRTTVPCPRVLYHDDSKTVVPYSFLIMEMLEGQPVFAALLNDADYQSVYRQIGRLLRQCHAVTFDQFGFISPKGQLGASARNRDFMRTRFERVLEAFSEAGGRSTVRQSVQARLDQANDAFDRCTTPVLCHNDVHEANVLITRRNDAWQISGLLDVGGAIAADPLYDVARTDYWSTRGNRRKHDALLDGYGPLPATAQASLGIYRVYHALELRNWFARSKTDPATLERIDADLDRLLSNVRRKSQ
jgi:aminoglycoside phosphotransferase (APT) family kinase protein